MCDLLAQIHYYFTKIGKICEFSSLIADFLDKTGLHFEKSITSQWQEEISRHSKKLLCSTISPPHVSGYDFKAHLHCSQKYPERL